jgi:hypothetical protein
MNGSGQAIRRLAGTALAHQLIISRILADLLKDKLDPQNAVDAFERDLMGDVAALQADADDAEGLEIRARVRDEMIAIVGLLRDGLRQLGV